MNHPVNDRTRALLAELGALRHLVEQRLGLASEAAREEWRKLRSRIPGPREIAAGVIELSAGELEDMKAKVERFAEILRRLGASASASAAAPVTPAPNGVRRARRPS